VSDYNELKEKKCVSVSKDFPSVHRLWDVVLAKPLEILDIYWIYSQNNNLDLWIYL